jgi:hypothetical protein
VIKAGFHHYSFISLFFVRVPGISDLGVRERTTDSRCWDPTLILVVVPHFVDQSKETENKGVTAFSFRDVRKLLHHFAEYGGIDFRKQ